jgi:hypothetical protein
MTVEPDRATPKADTRITPEPERKRRGPRFEIRNNMRVIVERDPRGVGPPIGSTDLASLNYDPEDAKHWAQFVRLQDCVATINRAVDRAVDQTASRASALAETIAQVLGKQLRICDQKTARVEKRVAAAELETANLRAAIAELALTVEKLRPKAAPRRKRAPPAVEGATVEAP